MSLQSRLADLITAVGADIKSHTSRITTLESGLIVGSTIAQESWHTIGAAGEPAFQNNWKANATKPPRYKKDPAGTVWLDGVVDETAAGAGVEGAVAFVLPAGYRPSQQIQATAWAYGSDTNLYAGVLDIYPNGNVIMEGVKAGIQVATWSLGGIEFSTDQATFPVGAPTTTPIEGWHNVGTGVEPAFQNSWTNLDARVCRFKKYPDGRVRLAGFVTGGAAGTVVFTLPVGYRPVEGVNFDENFAVSTGGANPSYGSVQVFPDGRVAVAVYAGSWISLNGIEFDTGQSVWPLGIAAPLTQAVEPWHQVGAAGEPAFLNGWVNYGTGYATAAFWKDPFGIVHLRGMIKSGTVANSAAGYVFNLPPGYRPVDNTQTKIFAVNSNDVFGEVKIDPSNGAVVVSAGSNFFVSLEGISFDTGQPTSPIANLQATQDAWHYISNANEPAFQNGWSNYGGNYAAVGYKKFPDGKVKLRGMIKGGTVTAGTAMFTLPVGYRPAGVSGGTALIFSVNSLDAFAEVRVRDDGAVLFQSGNAAWLSLDGIEFDTDQPTFQTAVALGNITQEGWHLVGAAGEPVFFVNSWVNAAVGVPARYRKDPAGNVVVQGDISVGASGTVAFTLPAGYRPDRDIFFGDLQDGGAAGGFVKIGADGTVTPTRTTTSAYIRVEFWTGQTAYPVGKAVIPVVTALPASATDGDEIYYMPNSGAGSTDSNSSAIWHLRYRAAAPHANYKWECLGGSPLYSGVETVGETKLLNGAARSDLATVGPQLTLPLRGDYMIQHGFFGYPNGGAGTPEMYQAIFVNGVEETSNHWAIIGYSSANGAAQATTKAFVRQDVLAGWLVQCKYGGNNTGGTGAWSGRYLTAIPRRVG